MKEIMAEDSIEPGSVAIIDPEEQRLEAQRRIDEAVRRGTGRRFEETGETTPRVALLQPTRDQVLAQVQTINNFFRQRENVLSELLKDPANKRRYEQDPAGFINAIDQQLLQDISARPEIGAIPAGRAVEDVAASEGVQSWEEDISIRTPLGGLRDIKLPRSREGKINHMRRVLGLVEESHESDGGMANRDALHEQGLIISSLLENNRTRAVAEEMYREFMARLVLHGSFREFQRADDAGKVLNSVSPLRAEHLNTLFRNIPGVWDAFIEYETHAKEFLEGSQGQQQEFREKIANKLAEKYKYTEDRGSSGQVEILPTDKFWAQRIAERLWEMTGRRAIRDSLVIRDPQKDPQKDFQQQRESGNVRFNSGGTITAGNFVTRRILRAKDYLDTAYNTFQTKHNKLLEGVRFQAQDFFSNLPPTLETYYKDREHLNTQEATLAVSELFGDGDTVQGLKIPKEGKEPVQAPNNPKEWEDQRWPDLIDAPSEGQPQEGEIEPIHLEKFQWNNFDFSVLGENPLLGWALYNITYADGFRAALYNGEGTGFSQRPSYEAFKEVIKNLSYQGSGQHDTRAKLFENLVRFLRFDNKKEFGAANLMYGAANNLIDMAARENVILKEKVEQIKKDALVWGGGRFKGTRLSRGFRLLFHYLSFLNALGASLSKFIESTVKAP